MLYRQIRYADEIRKLYRLRHLLTTRTGHSDIGSLLGFQKYSKQFYRMKLVLRKERILDRRGAFVESAPNLWIAELRPRASKEQTKALGHRIPYFVFLAATITPGAKTSNLSREFLIDRYLVHYAVRGLAAAKVLSVEERGPLYPSETLRLWLLRYIELSKSHADTTGDLFHLLSALPGYIGGPAAKYAIKYVPGSPIGPSDMVILSYKPFLEYWKLVVKETGYFKDYPKRVEVELARPSDEVVEIDGIPYKRNIRSRARPTP